MDQVLVDLDARSYPIYIGTNLLAKAGELLAKAVRSEKVMVITNPTVGEIYLDGLVEGLRESGYDVLATLVPDGEEHKTLAWASRLYDVLMDHKMDRGSTIMALGGGVIGDLAGFVAATFKRGLPFVQVPTTLLAQVDASIGGKVGVDHPRGKNMIGSFYQPRVVLIDLGVLNTLPYGEMRAGLAEVIKYGIITDEEFFGYLEGKIDALLARELHSLRFAVKRCCQIKASVVAHDEREMDQRAILNFGHTLGHAIEAACGYRLIRHGEAVAMGMVYAARIAVRLQMTGRETLTRLSSLIDRAGLGRKTRIANPQEMVEFLRQDKKIINGRVRFVLPTGIGQVVITDRVTEKVIREVLEESET